MAAVAAGAVREPVAVAVGPRVEVAQRGCRRLVADDLEHVGAAIDGQRSHDHRERGGIEPVQRRRRRVQHELVAANRGEMQVAPVDGVAARSQSEAPQAEPAQDAAGADVHRHDAQRLLAGELHVADADHPPARDVDDLRVEHVAHEVQQPAVMEARRRHPPEPHGFVGQSLDVLPGHVDGLAPSVAQSHRDDARAALFQDGEEVDDATDALAARSEDRQADELAQGARDARPGQLGYGPTSARSTSTSIGLASSGSAGSITAPCAVAR